MVITRHITIITERANIELEVSDQSHSYQNLADIKTQSVHGLAMEVSKPRFSGQALSNGSDRFGLPHPILCLANGKSNFYYDNPKM